jgi:glucan phosphoethanolaminetransferase (alkaline phosphatase superfamily)
MPDWLGNVNERLRAPVNALLTALAVAVLFAIFQNFALLPRSWAPPTGQLNLISTAWFSLLMAFLTWFMPGINAILGPFTRPDLLKNAPWRALLPVLGVVWAAFIGVLYWFAGLKPILDNLKSGKQGTLSYLTSSGVTMAIVLAGVAVIIYIIMAIRNRVAGVDTAMMYKVIPPE